MRTELPGHAARTSRSARRASRWPGPTSSWCRSSTRTAALVGVVTERALARRYIRESRADLDARGRADPRAARSSTCSRASWWSARTRSSRAGSGSSRWTSDSPSGISDGDVVVVGDRADAQRLAIELGAALLVDLQRPRPSEEVLELAREQGTRGGRLAARHLRLGPDDHARRAVPRVHGERPADRHRRTYLVADVSEQIKEIHYGAAVVGRRASAGRWG